LEAYKQSKEHFHKNEIARLATTASKWPSGGLLSVRQWIFSLYKRRIIFSSDFFSGKALIRGVQYLQNDEMTFIRATQETGVYVYMWIKLIYTAHIHVTYKSASKSLVCITCIISNFKLFNNSLPCYNISKDKLVFFIKIRRVQCTNKFYQPLWKFLSLPFPKNKLNPIFTEVELEFLMWNNNVQRKNA
jgi:hypothetical protein